MDGIGSEEDVVGHHLLDSDRMDIIGIITKSLPLQNEIDNARPNGRSEEAFAHLKPAFQEMKFQARLMDALPYPSR